MSEWSLHNAVVGIPSLRGLFITILPDALLFDAWVREGEPWVIEEVGTYFGDLVRSNREGLKALESWSSDMQVTIESSDLLIVLKEIKTDFVVGAVFDRAAPLGMVRLYVRKLMGRIMPMLPTEEIEERPKEIRILDFLKRYAPDPHAVLLRVALRMGTSLEILNDEEKVQTLGADRLEAVAKEIMGLEKLNL